jgi:hypothetical protein
MDDRLGIVFRDGPMGRRAGLAAGPDVWEVIAAMRSTGRSRSSSPSGLAPAAGMSKRSLSGVSFAG